MGWEIADGGCPRKDRGYLQTGWLSAIYETGENGGYTDEEWIRLSVGELVTVVYSSTAVDAFSEKDLAELLIRSCKNNARAGVTGMLLYRDGKFLQVLEGPQDIVQDRMSAITRDTRHHSVWVLLQEPISDRHFPDWTMAYPLVSATAAQEIPGYQSMFAETTTTKVRDVEKDKDPAQALRALRELIRWFQKNAIPLR